MVNTDEIIGVSELFGGHVPGLSPQSLRLWFCVQNPDVLHGNFH